MIRSRLLAVVVAFAAVVLVGVQLASGAGYGPSATKYSAALNVGQERPHPKGTKIRASGRFTATLSGMTLFWRLSFSHLTGPAIAAHIHKAPRGISGPVLISLCGPCTSPVTGKATITTAQLAALNAGKTYVNVHTAKNPNGEIRGQITKAH